MSEEYNQVFADLGLRVRTYSYVEKNLILKDIVEQCLGVEVQMGEVSQDQFEGWFLRDLNICRKEVLFLDNEENNYHCYIISETLPDNMNHPDVNWKEWEEEEGIMSVAKDFSEIEEAVSYLKERANLRGFLK